MNKRCPVARAPRVKSSERKNFHADLRRRAEPVGRCERRKDVKVFKIESEVRPNALPEEQIAKADRRLDGKGAGGKSGRERKVEEPHARGRLEAVVDVNRALERKGDGPLEAVGEEARVSHGEAEASVVVLSEGRRREERGEHRRQ